MTTWPIGIQFPRLRAWVTKQAKKAMIRGSLVCLANVFDMLYMGVCTVGNWQKSGRLVQELNVCTVP